MKASFWHAEDIVLEIIRLLDARDAISLVCTCTRLHALLSTRNFWLVLLKRLRRHRLPPCPSSLDLRTCTLSTLKHLTRHSNALQRAWTSPRAAPRAHGRYVLPDGYDFYISLEGTELALLLNYETGEICVVNYGCLSGAYSTPILVGAVNMTWTSTSQPGEYTILVHRSDTYTKAEVRINELCAYHLDYRDIVPVMTEVWSRPIQHDAHDGGDIDIFADGTAFGYAQVSSGMIHLHLWRTELDRYTGTSIPAPISMKDAPTTFLSVQEGCILYTVSDDNGTCVYRLPITSIADGTTPTLVRTVLSGECDPRAFFIGMSDSYDVVECFDGPDHGGQDQLGIAFRPSHPGGSASSSIISAPTLARVLVHDLEDYNGDPDMRPFDPLISNHHRDVLVSVLDYSQPDMVVKLKLVHFLEPVNEGGLGYTTCDISYPDSIVNIQSVSLDAALGVIYIQEEDSTLHRLLYA